MNVAIVRGRVQAFKVVSIATFLLFFAFVTVTMSYSLTRVQAQTADTPTITATSIDGSGVSRARIDFGNTFGTAVSLNEIFAGTTRVDTGITIASLSFTPSGQFDPTAALDCDGKIFFSTGISGITDTPVSIAVIIDNSGTSTFSSGDTLNLRITVFTATNPKLPAGEQPVFCDPGANRAPVADAGDQQTGMPGTTVTLDGSRSSDQDGDTLTYSWMQTSIQPGTRVIFTGADTATPTFIVPNTTGGVRLNFRLTVTDPGGETNTANTAVTVRTGTNAVPVVNAGDARTVTVNTTVTLDGSATDPDSDDSLLTYLWAQIGGTPTVFLTNVATSTATFTAPDVMTDDVVLTFSLTATDSGDISGFDTVDIAVDAPAVATANAGAGQTVDTGSRVTLDGSGSSGDSLTYLWTQTGGSPTVMLFDLGGGRVNFTAPATVPADPELTFNLQVTAGIGGPTDDDQVTITIALANRAPIADVGAVARTARVGDTVTLDASASMDPDGDVLGYSWLQFGISATSPGVTLDDFDSAVATFEVPSGTPVDTVFNFTVRVTDDDVTSTANVVITIIAAAPASTDASLSALSLSTGDFNESFVTTTLAYTADVAATVTRATVHGNRHR